MPTAKIAIKNHYSPSEVVKSPKGVKPAKQEFKDDTDLNSIMRKFQKTGSMDHAKIYQGQYGETSPVQLHEAMNLVKNADNMFNELPSSIRNKFENNAVKFYDYVQDANNYSEAKTLGISLSKEAEQSALALIESEAGAEQPAGPVGGEGTPPPAEA